MIEKYEINEFSETYLNYHNVIVSSKIRPLIIYDSWRGLLDTLQSFVYSSYSFQVYPILINWRQESWLFLRKNILNFNAINSIAKSLNCNLVLLLGSSLRLDRPAPLNSEITYISYYISSLNDIQEDMDNFEYCHKCYTAHSYLKNKIPNTEWLPTSVNLKQYKTIKEKNRNYIRKKDQLLLLFNKGDNKKEYRLKIIDELKKSKIKFKVYGLLIDRPINSYVSLLEILSSRLVLDDNRDLPYDNQFNDRFATCSALEVPVIANKNEDLDKCFNNYLFFETKLSIIENIEQVYTMDQKLIKEILHNNYKCIETMHQNEFRWANIFYYHIKRTNKL